MAWLRGKWAATKRLDTARLALATCRDTVEEDSRRVFTVWRSAEHVVAAALVGSLWQDGPQTGRDGVLRDFGKRAMERASLTEGFGGGSWVDYLERRKG